MQGRDAASCSAPAWQQLQPPQQQTPTRNVTAARATGLAMVTPPPRKPLSHDVRNAADAWQQQECAAVEVLEAEAARLGSIHSKQLAREAALRTALEDAYKEAHAQHAAAVAALQALASQLDRLRPLPDQPQPLQLCVGLPDAYSQQCAALERALEAHIDAAAEAPGADSTKTTRAQQQQQQQQQHNSRQAELDAVRSGLEGAIAAEAAVHVEVARLRAELAVLSTSPSDAAPLALPLGTAAADLQRENAALERRLASAMDGVRRAAAAAAAGETATAVQAQAEGRQEGMRRRHEAKGQAVEVLQRQVARQLLAAQRRRQEAAALQAAERAAAAAQQDAAAVLQASQRRVVRTAQRQEELRLAVAAEAPTEAADAEQHAAAAAAHVSELLALRRELPELAAQLQASVLPAQREAFAGMFAALFQDGDPSQPLLTPRPLAARLAAAEAAVAALDEAATAVLGEVLHKMQDTAHREVAERVLLQFFGGRRGELGKGAAPGAASSAGTAAGSGV